MMKMKTSVTLEYFSNWHCAI